jgi:stalled ribosome rescue protein Dom34
MEDVFMSHSHAIVWMDSKEAHVFQFNAEDVEKARVKAHNPFRKIHHKAGVIGAGHAHLDHAYFDDIAKALEGTTEWLLTGPSEAKDEMRSYLRASRPSLAATLKGVEAADHPTDGELLDHARRFFKAADRMLPNSPSRTKE